MSEKRREQEHLADVWTRWAWIWSFLFYAVVAVSVVALFYEHDGSVIDLWLPLALTLFMLAWHTVGLRIAERQSPNWEERVWPRFVVLMGDIVLWVILVNLSPAYYFILFGLYSQLFRYLPMQQATPAAVILTTAVLAQNFIEGDLSFSLSDPTLWMYLLMTGAGILFGVWISAIIKQSGERRELIEQLQQTQTELVAAERREGRLEERQRLARDIHDTLAQGFTSIVMHLEAAEQALPEDLDTLQKHLDQARVTARRSLEEARRVVHDLRPDLLERQSLPEAVERVVRRWSAESEVPVVVTATGTAVPLHPDIEVTLLRAIRESLNNIRKHAKATGVIVTLSYMEDVVILDVQDDGVGLNGAAPSPFTGGFGLQAMQERVAQFGGSVELESEVGEGTTLVVSIPIQVEGT